MSTNRMIRVLVAEDELLFLNSLIKKIERCDPCFKVVASAHNGKMALELISEIKPDVLFTDIRMPVMDGMELIENARKLFPDILIVVLSGYNEFAYARSALQAGVTDYMLKPVTDENLAEVLKKLKEQVFSKYSELERKIIFSQLNGENTDASISQTFVKSKVAIFLISVGNLGTYLTSTNQIKIFSELWNRVIWNDVICSITAPIDDWVIVDEKSPNQKFVILIISKHSTCDLNVIAKRLSENLLPNFAPYTINICSNGISVTYNDIWLVSQKLRSLLEKEFVIGPSKVLFESATQSEVKDTLVDENFKFKINSLLSANKFNVMTQMIQKLFQTWENQGYTQRVVEKSFFDLIDIILLYLRKQNNSDHFMPYDYKSELLEFIAVTPDYNSICGHVLDMIAQMLNQQPEEVNQPSHRADLIEKYLREHYFEDVSLEELSGHFHFSSAYLTKIFKKFKDDTPLKFLTGLRIEEAKRLIIEHPELDYKVIGEMVGYFDCHYFYKVFKYCVGKTPTEFRGDYEA